MYRAVFVLCIAACLFTSAHAETRRHILDVEHITVEDGLLHREVNGVFEDRNGLIWILTTVGLQRYDGQTFKSWTREDKTGLIYGLTSISQDDTGWLWLWNNQVKQFVFLHAETEEILSIDERFESGLPFQYEAGRRQLATGAHWPLQNKYGQMCFGTQDGYIITYDSVNGFRELKLAGNALARLDFIDSASNYWIQSNNWYGGVPSALYKIDTAGNILLEIPIPNGYQAGHFGEYEGQVFYGLSRPGDTSKIMYACLPNGEQRSFDLHGRASLGAEIVGDQFWVLDPATSWEIYDIESEALLAKIKRSDYPDGLFDYAYLSLVDSRGIVWISSGFGLFKIQFKKNKFQNYFAFEDEKLKPVNNSVRGIYTNGDSIFFNCEVSHSIFLDKEKASDWGILLSDRWARPLMMNDAGNFWIGVSDGLKEVDTRGNLINQYAHRDRLYFNVWSLYHDKNGQLWLGCGDILMYLDREAGQLVDVAIQNPHIIPNGVFLSIFHIEPYDDRHLWLCTGTGLYLLDTQHNRLTDRYASDSEGHHFIPTQNVHHMHKDEAGVYWLASKDGLIRWLGPDTLRRPNDTDWTKLFTKKNGFSNNTIYAVYEDSQRRLWLSSDWGIMAFDKASERVIAFDEGDGISHLEFNRTSHFRDDKGVIYFGGLNGITSFHPDDFVLEEGHSAHMFITDYEKFDGSEQRLVNRTTQLRASHQIDFYPGDRFFRMHFALPTFSASDEYLYAWKIDGIHPDWNYQEDNSIQINTLPYGSHQLRIKGQSGGSWSPHELNIRVRVHKPFYLQTWFIALSIVLLGAGIIAFFRIRTRVLKNEIEKATLQIQRDKQTIEQQAQELQKLDALKSRFFANVSHELRTPLSLMMGPIKNLQRFEGHREKEVKLLGFLHRNTLHLRNLVNEILDLSKLENNKLELQEEAVDFYAYLKEHMSQFYSFGSSASVRVTANFPENAQGHILLDKRKFEKVINNFMSNAIKFTPPHGEVSITITESAGEIIVRVADSGRGIHPEDLPHIFDRFYQSKRVEASTEGGTGIGLALCRELAELMGGRVWAESERGAGSQFYFALPRKTATVQEGRTSTPNQSSQSQAPPLQEAQAVAAVKMQPSGHTSEATILIAEDNADLRQYYEIILPHYHVITTEHGQAALDYLEGADQIPDLIISDLMMPVMDGMQLINTLKASASWRHIPIIMLTAKANRNVKLQALRIGIDDYITKPFDDEELVVRMGNLLQHAIQRSRYQQEAEHLDVPETDSQLNDSDQAWLAQLEQNIIDHIHDSRFGMEFLSGLMQMSRRQLQRKIKQLVGLTPKEYVNEVRFHQIRELLLTGAVQSVSEAAQKCGFSNVDYFSQQFKRRFGKSPSAFLS